MGIVWNRKRCEQGQQRTNRTKWAIETREKSWINSKPALTSAILTRMFTDAHQWHPGPWGGPRESLSSPTSAGEAAAASLPLCRRGLDVMRASPRFPQEKEMSLFYTDGSAA